MKKYFFYSILIALVLFGLVVTFRLNSNQKMVIKLAKLSKEEENMVQLIKPNISPISIYEVNVDGNVKYAQIKLYTLDKNGEWQGGGGSGGHISHFTGEKEKEFMMALVNITSEGGTINYNTGGLQFIFPKIEGQEIPNENDTWKSTYTLVSEKITDGKEIPILLYVEKEGESIEATTIDYFFTPKKLLNFDSVHAVTITFTENPVEL